MLHSVKSVAIVMLSCFLILIATIGCSGDGPTGTDLESKDYSQRMHNSSNTNIDSYAQSGENNRNNTNRRYEFSNKNKYGRDNPHSNRMHDKPKNDHYPHNDDPVLMRVITFEDILDELPNYDMGSQHAIITFNDISWDHDGIPGGWGFGVYNTSNSQPHSGNNYVLNRHGKNFLGFTFPQVVNFKGAHFAMAVSNAGMDPNNPAGHSAVKLRYHFYDENLDFITTSDWFDLQVTSELFAADIYVKRVVIEHDILNPTTAGFPGFIVTDAEWYSMDDVLFSTE